jgi:hypothetical protein
MVQTEKQFFGLKWRLQGTKKTVWKMGPWVGLLASSFEAKNGLKNLAARAWFLKPILASF